jgi:hypothetical protein
MKAITVDYVFEVACEAYLDRQHEEKLAAS